MRLIAKLFSPLISLRTAVALLTVICVLSIIGTLVPQGLETRDYLKLYPRCGHWILAIGADDLYRGWLFLGAFGVLFVSTLLCTLMRYRLTRRRLFERLHYVSWLEIRSFPVRLELEPLKNRLASLAGYSGKNLEDGTSIWFSVFGRGALIGALLLHLGLLLILAGGEVDSLLGVELPIRGRAGELVRMPGIEGLRAAARGDQLRLRGRRLQENNPQNPDLMMLKMEIEQLDRQYQLALASPAFKVVFEELWMDFHQTVSSETSGTIRNWNTRLAVQENGIKVASAVVRVNEPFAYGPYTFFQSDWDKLFTNIHLKVRPFVGSLASDLGSQTFDLVASVGSIVKPEWSSSSFVIRQFFPDFRVTDDAQFVSVSNDFNNPACRIEAYDDNGNLLGRTWGFARQMIEIASHGADLPYSFRVVSADTEFETGLQVTHKPGVMVVWLGCFLFTLGLVLTFYISYIELWVVQRPDGRVILAVHGNRHPLVLQRYLDGLKKTVEMSEATVIRTS